MGKKRDTLSLGMAEDRGFCVKREPDLRGFFTKVELSGGGSSHFDPNHRLQINGLG